MPPPTNNPAPTTNLQTAYDEEAATYQPQVNQVGVQLQALPGQQAQALSSLDQAKANAFKTNSTNANARGVLFGGVVPQANQDYTTNTYNPAVTNTNQKFSDQSQSLQDKITSINQERSNAAQGLVNDTQAAQDAAEAAAERASASVAKSNASTAAKASATANAASYVQGSKGQYMYVGANGKPINMQQYVSDTGGDANTVLGLLQGGTSYDKAIYNKLVAAKPTTSTQLFNLLREYDTAKAYGY